MRLTFDGPRLWAALILLHWLAFLGPVRAAEEPVFDGGPITADALAELVRAQNPGIKAREATAEAAKYRIAPAGALDDPMLSYAPAPATVGGPRGLQQWVELSQPLPWPGKLALREEAAQQRASAAASDVADLLLQVTAAAKALFAEWAYVHRALSINQEHQTLLGELRRVAEIQYAAGRAAQQDALQAEVARVRLETEAATLERGRSEVRARLNALLNRPPQALIPPPAGLPEPGPLPPLEQLQDVAVGVHPELARIRARIAEAKANAGLAEKDYYPDFRVMTGYNSLWDDSDQRWTIGLSVNLPFDYGRKRSAALEAANAELRQTQWQLTDREAQLLGELEASRAAVEETADVTGIYVRDLVPLAQDNLDAALADYRAGAGPFINVIDAERQRLRTEEGLARARADFLRRLAELERWLGTSLSDLLATEMR